RHRRVSLRRQVLRSARGAATHRLEPQFAATPHLPALPEPGRPLAVAVRRALADAPRQARRRPGAVRVRAGAVRSSPVDLVLVRDYRVTQADRPWSRRDPPRDSEERDVPLRPASARAGVLLHHHRLDALELPGQYTTNRSR